MNTRMRERTPPWSRDRVAIVERGGSDLRPRAAPRATQAQPRRVRSRAPLGRPRARVGRELGLEPQAEPSEKCMGDRAGQIGPRRPVFGPGQRVCAVCVGRENALCPSPAAPRGARPGHRVAASNAFAADTGTSTSSRNAGGGHWWPPWSPLRAGASPACGFELCSGRPWTISTSPGAGARRSRVTIYRAGTH